MKTMILKTMKSRAFLFLSGIAAACISTNPARAEAPSGFQYAADEGGTSYFNNPVNVAYGVNGIWAYWYGTAGSVKFSPGTFGYDPVPGVRKAGYFQWYGKVADEGGKVTFSQPTDVAYGVNGVFEFRYGVTGEVTFLPASFGGSFATDPVPGVRKSGYAFTRGTGGFQDLFCIGSNEAVYKKHYGNNTGWPADFESLGGGAKQVTVARNEDGHQEIFIIGTNDKLYHNWETPSGGWSGWQSFGVYGKQLAVGQNLDGRLELIYIDMNNRVCDIYQNAPNGNWVNSVALGGEAKQVTVGQNADGRLEIFYVGTNNSLYHNYQGSPNGQFYGENFLGEGPASQIAVESNKDGRMEVFTRGLTNNVISHIWQTAPNSGWSGWSSFGITAKQMAIGQNPDGRLEVFYIGTDNAIWHFWQQTSGGWTGGYSLGGGNVSQIAVGQTVDDHLEVFHVGTNNNIYHNYQQASGGWSNYEWLGSGGVAPVKQIALGLSLDEHKERRFLMMHEAFLYNPPAGSWLHVTVHPDETSPLENGHYTRANLFLENKSWAFAAIYSSDTPIQLTFTYVMTKPGQETHYPMQTVNSYTFIPAFQYPAFYGPTRLGNVGVAKPSNWEQHVQADIDAGYVYQYTTVGVTGTANLMSRNYYYYDDSNFAVIR